jgi:hypothetical protein
MTALAATSILSAAAFASDVTAPKLTLTAYTNGVGGENLMAGKYDDALAEIKKDHVASSYSYTAKINNQCVAYAAMKQIPQALSACDEALRAAKYERIAAQRFSALTRIENSYLAIAYTNRAIVHTLAKDSESAKADMAHAQALAPSAEIVTLNMLAMQTSASKIAQLGVTPAR